MQQLSVSRAEDRVLSAEITRNRGDLGGGHGFLMGPSHAMPRHAMPRQLFCHLSVNSLTELQGLFITEKEYLGQCLVSLAPGHVDQEGRGNTAISCRDVKAWTVYPWPGMAPAAKHLGLTGSNFFAASGEMGTCRWNLGAVSSMLSSRRATGVSRPLVGRAGRTVCSCR